MSFYNRYGAIEERFKPVDTVVSDTAKMLVKFCNDNNLSMEEITLLFSSAMATLSCYEAETRLRKGLELRKTEKANALKDR